MNSPVPSFFNNAVIEPAQCAWKTSMRLSEKVGLTKAAQVGFRFFKSYGDNPKDLAKAFQVLGEWVVVFCKKKSAFNGLETAQKIVDVSKQAKCFLSFSGICSQLVKVKTALVGPEHPLPNGVPHCVNPQPERNIFTARALKEVIDTGSGLCANAFDTVTLLSVLGLISSKNKYMPAIKIGTWIATVLGAIARLGDDGNKLHGEYAQGNLRSRNGWEKTVSIAGHAAVFSLGAFPLIDRFKGYKPSDDNFFLKLSTISVLSTLFSKHIPKSLFST
jgi:hypothetical protein